MLMKRYLLLKINQNCGKIMKNLLKKVKVMMSKNKPLFNTVLSALFLGIALVLPFLTGQVPQIGKSLCPMHIPVMLCGFFCGPWYAAAVGLIAPFLRFALFGMPAVVPDGVVMCAELAAYGITAALLYRALPQKKIFVYVSLIGSMIAGRIVWGGMRTLLYGLGKAPFGFSVFITVGFINALPGIVLQLILIPIIVMPLKKYTKC